MSNPKVFEYAKEIGMTPLALMDKIREWHLPVKSHMAELEPEMLETIKAKLQEGSRPTAAPAPAKKPAARKKAAPVAEAPAKPVTVKKTKTAVEAAKAETPAAKPAGGAAVVRRKKAAEVTPEVKEEAAGHPEVEPLEEVVVAPVAKSAKVVELAQAEEKPVAAATAPTPAVTSVAAPTPVPAAPTPVTEEPEKKVVARKKEVSIGNSGISSDALAPAAPKRNIVGRMDLSRVQPPLGTGSGGYASREGGRPGGPRAGGPGGGFQRQQGGPGSFGPARSKGNIRAGFFQAPAPDLTPAESSEDYKRKDEKRRMKGGFGEAAVSTRELDETPPAFDAAEFRKREMVFQPKKKKDSLDRPAMKTQITTPSARKRVVKVYGSMKVSDLANAMGMKAPELIKTLMKNGVMATMNTELDFDTIALIVGDFGWEAQNVQKTAEEVIVETAFGDLEAEPTLRSPVVAVMGHVDHGKTSLLDAIRSAKVAEGEAGGITQHIGAYQVTLDDGYKITFLDTPGHEAFTAMRARGANVTDIAIIVVAADDGVMPQTAEAINHAKAAKVPMIVAVNKMDKPGANPDRIKQQLTEYEVVPEEWGGSTIFAPVSALKKTGIKELLEQVKLVAEVMELKANPKRSGTGTVIESRLEKGRGSVATILVKDGSVEVGQYIVAGTVKGKIRSLMNDRGERVQSAGPGQPVEILGLESVPQAGDRFDIVKDERAAEEAAKIRIELAEKAKNESKKLSLDEIFSKVQKGDVKELPVILKTDVAGSLEAIQGMFSKLSTPEVKVKVIHAAIGGITESDVLLATTAKGIIIGFNVRPDSGAQNMAKRNGIEVRTYSIVYELIDDMKKAMTGLLTPDVVEKVMGRSEVRNTFSVPKIGTIAGCFVTEGKIMRSNMARLIREGKIVYEGKIASLKRFKDDAKEVASGFECGIGIENFNDIKVGDVIEAYMKEEVARELTQNAEA